MKPEIINRFKKASRDYSDTSVFMHEVIAKRAGLSSGDHKYLGIILDNKQLTAGEIAELTGLTTGAVTGLIDRLEAKKLVKREFTKDDRRKVIIVAQEENCIKLFKPLFEDLLKKTASLISTFSEKELAVIERYFIEATKIMKEITNQLNQK